MGQRANLIVVGDGGYELYYTHWRANTLPRDLFWGPEHALAFIRRQRSRADGAEWLDEVWAEGGALMDPRRSLLLWWGGEDVCFDVSQRRLLLELMAIPWSGWEVRWAHEGIAELADYVGVPRAQVLTEHEPEQLTLAPPEQRDWIDGVVSARLDGGRVVFFPLAGDVEERLWCCDELAREIERAPGHAALDYREWSTSFPQSGAHVDLPERTVTFWTAAARPAVEHRLRERNPSWRMVWCRDRYESQLEVAGAGLSFPTLDRSKLLETVTQGLLNPERDFTGYIERVAQESHPGERVDINPFATRDDPLPLDVEERRRRLAEILRLWRARST